MLSAELVIGHGATALSLVDKVVTEVHEIALIAAGCGPFLNEKHLTTPRLEPICMYMKYDKSLTYSALSVYDARFPISVVLGNNPNQTLNSDLLAGCGLCCASRGASWRWPCAAPRPRAQPPMCAHPRP